MSETVRQPVFHANCRRELWLAAADKECSVRQPIFSHKCGNQEVLTLHFSKCSNNCRRREVRTNPPPYVRLPLTRLALLLFSALLPVLWTVLNLIRRALMFGRILGGNFLLKCQRISTSSGSFANPSTSASQRVSGSPYSICVADWTQYVILCVLLLV